MKSVKKLEVTKMLKKHVIISFLILIAYLFICMIDSHYLKIIGYDL